jgi:hypothetical protein
MDLLKEYPGVRGDTDLEMQYVETQLNIWIKENYQQSSSDSYIQNTVNMISQEWGSTLPTIRVKIPGSEKDRLVVDRVAKAVSR